MRKLFALALLALALAGGVAFVSIEHSTPAPRAAPQTAETSPFGVPPMRKLLALALLALALVGGVAFVSLEKPTPTSACPNGNGC